MHKRSTGFTTWKHEHDFMNELVVRIRRSFPLPSLYLQRHFCWHRRSAMKPSRWNVSKQYVHLFHSLETRSLAESERENRSCQERPTNIQSVLGIMHFFWTTNILKRYILFQHRDIRDFCKRVEIKKISVSTRFLMCK